MGRDKETCIETIARSHPHDIIFYITHIPHSRTNNLGEELPPRNQCDEYPQIFGYRITDDRNKGIGIIPGTGKFRTDSWEERFLSDKGDERRYETCFNTGIGVEFCFPAYQIGVDVFEGEISISAPREYSSWTRKNEERIIRKKSRIIEPYGYKKIFDDIATRYFIELVHRYEEHQTSL